MKHIFAGMLFCTAVLSAQAQSKKIIVTEGISAAITISGNEAQVVLSNNNEPVTLDLDELPETTKSIKTADYNFDGYRDFAVLAPKPAATNYKVYNIFLYNAKAKSFDALEAPAGGYCEQWANVQLNAGKKELYTSCRTEEKWAKDTYAWDGKGNLSFVTTRGGSPENDPTSAGDAEEDEAKLEAQEAREEIRQAKREAREERAATRQEKSEELREVRQERVQERKERAADRRSKGD